MIRALALLFCLLPLAGCPVSGGPVLPIATWQGAMAVQSTPLQVLATDAEEWQSLWALAGEEPPVPLPAGAAAVGIFLGERPTGGHVLQLRARRLGGGELLVEWREEPPGADAMVTQVVTHPWAIETYPSADGRLLLRPAP